MSRTTKQKKTGGKAVSSHCQNNGSCSYCYSNRLIHTLKELDRTSNKLIDEEWESSSSDWREVNKKESEDYYYKNFYPDFDFIDNWNGRIYSKD